MTLLAIPVSAWGFRVHVADDVMALRLAARHCPAVVILDVGMPSMCGWSGSMDCESCRLEGVLLVALLGHAAEADRCHSLRQAAILHLSEPHP